MILIVTVKLPKNQRHNPNDKRFGTCGCKENLMCSDRIGEHHSFLMIGDTFQEIEERARKKYGNLTRIEHPYFTGLGINENVVEDMIHFSNYIFNLGFENE